MQDLLNVQARMTDCFLGAALGEGEVIELLKTMDRIRRRVEALLRARRAELASLAARIEGERKRVSRVIDPGNLSDPAIIEKNRTLETLINRYLCLNEGLCRADEGGEGEGE